MTSNLARIQAPKIAKIAGDTSGNYHPHGESVVYPTLVNMGQDWKMRTMLVDKQGNFGSIDGDPPAAMRYTEARMTQAAVEMTDLKSTRLISNPTTTRPETNQPSSPLDSPTCWSTAPPALRWA